MSLSTQKTTQTTPVWFEVPKGMSCVNALHALLKQTPLYTITEKKAQQLAQTIQDSSGMDSEGKLVVKLSLCKNNKIILVDFSGFPKLDVSQYNDLYGDSAAQTAILAYHERSSDKQIDPSNRFKFSELAYKEVYKEKESK